MSASPARDHRPGLPTLTEVIEWPQAASPGEPDAGLPEPPSAEPPLPTAALPTEDQLTRRVMADLQVQIDLMLDYRLREILTPLLARAADSLIRDARQELASTLRDVVVRAVAKELSRHRNG